LYDVYKDAMTTEEKLAALVEVATAHDRQIEKITANQAAAAETLRALADTLAKHDSQIENILAALDRHSAEFDRTDASIRAMADQFQSLTREWEAYLRRIPRN